MKPKLQKIAFYYFVLAAVAAYLVTAISLIANQNWYEYFVSPVYPYCQLLVAGIVLNRPVEIALSILPFLFICVSCTLYFIKSEYYSLFARPVLQGNISLIAIIIIFILFGIISFSGRGEISGTEIAYLFSNILEIALWIVLFWRKRS